MPQIEIIGHIRTDLPEKFGVPRQSGLVPELTGKIVFIEKYRQPEAFNGLDEFSHIWLLWQFSKVRERQNWSPSVRPPKLGGNTRKGVFATRSPFRPNRIGLSCVKLDAVKIENTTGPTIYVSGVDLMDGTPILDIKPYLPYADSLPEATGGFTDSLDFTSIVVQIPTEIESIFSQQKLLALKHILAQDPRPAYHNDDSRIYGLSFAGYNIKFYIKDNCLTVIDAIPESI